MQGKKSGNVLKNKENQGKVREFCSVKLLFSQSEHPNYENFLGEHAPDPPKQCWTHIRIQL